MWQQAGESSDSVRRMSWFPVPEVHGAGKLPVLTTVSGSIGTLRIWPRSYIASVLNRKRAGLGSGSAPHPSPHGEAAMAGGCFR